jgi:hypothetical protein
MNALIGRTRADRFLAGPHAGKSHGAILSVDGGWSAT